MENVKEQEKMNAHYSMSSVHRVIQVLRVFKDGEKKLSLTDIHKKTGIGISSLQRILWTLVYEGFLIKDEESKLYSLGLELFFLGRLVEQNDAFLSVAIPVMERLNEETNENISVSVIENGERKCICNLPSRHELSALTFIGHTSPLYAGASAKLLLAFQDDEFIKDYLDKVEFESITDVTVTSTDKLADDLRRIRQNGYAITYGERVKGAMSISAPIKINGDTAFAVFTVTIPRAREEDYDIGELIRKVVDGAREIEERVRRENN
jgi:IclR family transcriptional regulator, KDG regulon repressor